MPKDFDDVGKIFRFWCGPGRWLMFIESQITKSLEAGGAV